MKTRNKSVRVKHELLNKCPSPDIALCSSCGWKGSVTLCGLEKEGDWESGYHYYHTCPECKDGGVDDYDYSLEQAKKLEQWWKENSK